MLCKCDVFELIQLLNETMDFYFILFFPLIRNISYAFSYFRQFPLLFTSQFIHLGFIFVFKLKISKNRIETMTCLPILFLMSDSSSSSFFFIFLHRRMHPRISFNPVHHEQNSENKSIMFFHAYDCIEFEIWSVINFLSCTEINNNFVSRKKNQKIILERESEREREREKEMRDECVLI